MSHWKLPERASLEYLKKAAKERLETLRAGDPGTKLAEALLAVARDYGFASWRALKAEVEHRRASQGQRFMSACATGDVAAVREMLAHDPGLVHARHPDPPVPETAGLHAAAVRGHLAVVQLLLQAGASTTARDSGDQATPLHWAAAHGHVEVMRALLDAGADVEGEGDRHGMNVIGWAAALAPVGTRSAAGIALLVERGARHHIFSAIGAGDAAVVRAVVEQNPEEIDRRMSRFERNQTALHFAVEQGRMDMLDLLIDLGADLEATDANGNTALAAAAMRGAEAMATRLRAAGAQEPARMDETSVRDRMKVLAAATRKGVPMICVPDIGAAMGWYESIGFQGVARFEEDGVVNFGMVTFGKAELMFRPESPGDSRPRDVSLWFYTAEVDALYRTLRASEMQILFEEDIYDPSYGGRQFSIRDPFGYSLLFYRDE